MATIQQLHAAMTRDWRRRRATESDKTMRPGGEDDQRVPAHKRRDTYGNPTTGAFRSSNYRDSKDFADEVDKGNETLSPAHRDAARLHARSLKGGDKATAISREEINRRLYNRSNHK